MNWFQQIFTRRKLYNDLSEEMQEHLEEKIDELVASGMTRTDAEAAARKQFGNMTLTEERSREVWQWPTVESFLADIRFGARMLRKTPAITCVALLSIALGIGANTAIFSLLDSVMLRMLPVQKPDELAQVAMRRPKAPNRPQEVFTNPLWEQVRDHQTVFSGVFAWSQLDFNLANGGEAENVHGLYVSGGYFNTLGVAPAVGRLLTAEDDRRGCPGAAVLSYGFWQQHYGGAESAIGSPIRLDGHSFPVIGVTPPAFFGTDVGQHFDVAIPMCAEAIIAGKQSLLDERPGWWLTIMGRLKPGVSPEQAAAGLNVLAPQILAESVEPNWRPASQQDFRSWTFTTSPAGTGLSFLRRRYTRPLEALMVVVGLVLLIACANIASLMLARSAARQKEIAVRFSLGASRARLIRQVLTESILLSTAGALLGLLFARWGEALLVRMVSTNRVKVFLDLSMNRGVLLFTAGIAILTGLLFGVLPAFRGTRVSLASAMKGGDRQGDEGRSRFLSGRLIVSVQVALSLILLVGTGLFVRTFRNLLTLDLGFDAKNVLLVSTNIENANIPETARLSTYGQMLERLGAIPGVASVSQCWFTPLFGYMWSNSIQVDGGQNPSSGDPEVYFNWITPGYFSTMRTPLLAGRTFDANDTLSSPPVAVVNETVAQHFFPNANPIGKYFRIGDPPKADAQTLQIVGIVKDSKYESSLREPAPPFAYFPAAQVKDLPNFSNFELRAAVDPNSVIPSVRDAMAGVNKAASLQFVTLERQVDDTLVQERLLATLSAFFGGLALLLTAIGLYGVMAYVVSQRTHEIGIRMALGANPGSVLRLVMGDVAALLAAGVTAGALASYWATRLTQQFLFGVQARDALTAVLAVAALFAVALFASYLPARRAMRVDPMIALRYE